MMRIGRTLPPAASPIGWKNFAYGLLGMVRGDAVRQNFNADLCRFFDRRHCFLVSSGKAALTIILKALHKRYPDRDEVLIPAFTCYSVPSAIKRAGLKIRLCDLDCKQLDFDLEKIVKLLDNKKLLCVIPAHLFGIPADVKALRRLVKDPEVTIVEDAAQAMGGVSGDQQLGTLGDVGFFSLGRGKAFSTVEGGIIVTNDDTLAGLLKEFYGPLGGYGPLGIIKLVAYTIILNIFMNPWLFWLPMGLPFLRLGETIYDTSFGLKKMSPFQAGLGTNWRKTLLNSQRIRMANVLAWEKVLDSSFIIHKDLCVQPLIRLPVMMRNRSEMKSLIHKSKASGLGISPTYPRAVHEIEQISGEFTNIEFPVASDTAKRLVTLPLHRYLCSNDIERIVHLFRP